MNNKILYVCQNIWMLSKCVDRRMQNKRVYGMHISNMSKIIGAYSMISDDDMISDSDELLPYLQQKELICITSPTNKQVLVFLSGSLGTFDTLFQNFETFFLQCVGKIVFNLISLIPKTLTELCFNNISTESVCDIMELQSSYSVMTVCFTRTEFKPLISMENISSPTLFIEKQNNICDGLTTYLHKITAAALVCIKSSLYCSETSLHGDTSKTADKNISKTSINFIHIMCFLCVLASDKCLNFIWFVICREKLNNFLIYSHTLQKRKSKENDKMLLNYLLKLKSFEIQQNIQAYPVDRLSVNYMLDIETLGNTSLSRNGMSNELLRLSTFSNYPQREVSLIRLAAAGFYSEGQSDEVVCFSCGLRIKHWSANLNPAVVHQQYSPECQHIKEITSTLQSSELNASQISIDGNTVGYKPRADISGQPICSAVGINEGSHHLLISSSKSAVRVPEHPSNTQSPTTSLEVGNRSLSTSKLPLSVQYREADSGYGSTLSLYSTTNTNTTNSPGLPGRWASSDSGFGSGLNLSNPIQQNGGNFRHAKENRQISCDGASNLVDSTGQLSLIVEELQQSQPDVPSGNDNDRSHILTATNGLSRTSARDSYKKYPEYECLQSRKKSFKNWPSNKNFINVNDLAESGFFFTNLEDCVRCFQCGIGLKNWDRDDMVWVEHARWSSRCQYVIEIKGQSFIDCVLELVSNTETDNNELHIDTAHNPTSSHHTSTDAPGHGLRQDNPMEHKAARYVLTEKIFEDEELIKKSMNHLLKTTGWDSITNDTLVACILDTIGTDECATVIASNSTYESENHNSSGCLSLMSDSATDKKSKSKEMIESDGKSEAVGESERIQKENEELQDLYTCKICLDKKVDITFVPCGHLVTCHNCSPKIRKCPLCRKFIRGTINTTI